MYLTRFRLFSSWMAKVTKVVEKSKTKIVCTIGPSTSSEQMLVRLIDAGMNVARLNFAHGDLAEKATWMRRIRRAATTTRIPVGVLVDLPGPKIRVGEVSPEPTILREGSQLTLTARRVVGNSRLLSISHPSVLRELSAGDSVSLEDGTIELAVQHALGDEAVCRVTRGGALFSGKGVNLPGKLLRVKAPTKEDVRLMRFALKNGADFIGLSFTKSVNDVIAAKRIAMGTRRPAWIIAKIENRQAVEDFDEILHEADGAMVARGDLGVEMGIDDIPLLQKTIIRKANEAGKPVITATQMLESMVENPTPTRAEVSDIANAIIDGTDAIMLSEETAVGKYPVEAVRVMRRVAAATEKALPYSALLDLRRALVGRIVQDAISFSACDVAHKLGASCIVAHTRTGLTAHRVSKFRSSVPIIALTYSTPVMNRLSLLWGVYPRQVKKLRTTAEIFSAAERAALASRIAHRGSRIVVVCGDPSTPSGTTDLLRVQTI